MSIGERLRKERERLKLTQPDFAATAGAKKRTLIDWEQGVSSPTAVQLSALSEIGVDVLYVLTGARLEARAQTPLENVLTATEAAMNAVGKPKQLARLHEAVFEQLQSAKALPLMNNELPAYAAPLSRAERDLLDNYQAADDQGKFIIESVAALAARPKG